MRTRMKILPEEKTSCFLFHKWGKWDEGIKGDILDHENNILGHYIRQTRACIICNKKQLRVSEV